VVWCLPARWMRRRRRVPRRTNCHQGARCSVLERVGLSADICNSRLRLWARSASIIHPAACASGPCLSLGKGGSALGFRMEVVVDGAGLYSSPRLILAH
jgi:hypothetical protein